MQPAQVSTHVVVKEGIQEVSCGAVEGGRAECVQTTGSSEKRAAKLRESSASLRLAGAYQNRAFFLHKPVPVLLSGARN